MNNYRINLLLLTLLASGCGQTGPLYLPTDKPPIAVSSEQKKELEKDSTKKAQQPQEASKPLPEEKNKETPEESLETPPDLTKEN